MPEDIMTFANGDVDAHHAQSVLQLLAIVSTVVVVVPFLLDKLLCCCQCINGPREEGTNSCIFPSQSPKTDKGMLRLLGFRGLGV